jgi:hypothetical protein
VIPSLPSASSLALGKEQTIFFEIFFADCLQTSAWQRANHLFCREPSVWHSAQVYRISKFDGLKIDIRVT